MATNSIESFLNITRDTFLYTIPFYKLEGIAIPFNDYLEGLHLDIAAAAMQKEMIKYAYYD